MEDDETNMVFMDVGLEVHYKQGKRHLYVNWEDYEDMSEWMKPKVEEWEGKVKNLGWYTTR